MTTSIFFQEMISIVADLSRDFPGTQRYQRLLDAIARIFPCDAAAILQLQDNVLRPLAVAGLSDDTLGRRFAVNEHPRLAHLLHSREPVRFPADSSLPDPYDGLVETEDHQLHVHDCMGVSLYIDEKPWGVLSLDALQPGTFDAIDPVELRTFIRLTEATVKAALRIEALEARIEQGHLVTAALLEGEGKVDLIGESRSIQQLMEEIATVAKSHLTVLVLGETGVGKELVARRIHQLSPRADKPLIYVNCAALPEAIAETELFGHVKGAFTGAVSDRAGKFEVADGGTLFLDEIGELPLGVQAKMLRVLQSGEIQRVGSDHYRQVDVRIVAATNRDLHQEVAREKFRPDLYHRLSVFPIHVPPLRERGRDVLLLAGYLLERDQRRLGIQSVRLAADARHLLQSYDWPGNVRELEHLLSRSALKAVAEQGLETRPVTIHARHLDIASQSRDDLAETESVALVSAGQIDLREAIDQFQARLITEKLKRNNNNYAATARDLGLNRSNFYRLVQRLKIKP
ncbi:MAG: nitric oxide reductase transcriptional regulator NorR [Porticoccaceae bacterium]|nr:nitric oxide reductase transcriptional regulator NorR [Porticoccaceae bacterium]